MLSSLKKFGALLFLFLIEAQAVLAQSRPAIIPPGTSQEIMIPIIPKDSQGIPQEQFLGGVFLPTITRIVIASAGASAVIFIIIGGIEMLTAYGNDEKITNAKKTITYAIVGLLVALLSYAIVTIISSVKL